MNNTLLHARWDKVTSGVWGLVTALDDWMGGTPHSRRFRERQELHESQTNSKTKNLYL